MHTLLSHLSARADSIRLGKGEWICGQIFSSGNIDQSTCICEQCSMLQSSVRSRTRACFFLAHTLSGLFIPGILDGVDLVGVIRRRRCVRGGPKAGLGRAECSGIPGSLWIRVGHGHSGGVGAAGCESGVWNSVSALSGVGCGAGVAGRLGTRGAEPPSEVLGTL